MIKIRVGIDIGQDGAYAVFQDGQLKHYAKIPDVSGELNMDMMLDDIFNIIPSEHSTIHVALEDLHSVYNSSAASNFQFGVNNGLIIGALQAFKIPYTKIQPKKWQKQMWEGIRTVMKPVKGELDKEGNQKYKVDTKATSLIAAQRLFPNEKFLATVRSRVPHDGIVDAVLIGLYCVRNF